MNKLATSLFLSLFGLTCAKAEPGDDIAKAVESPPGSGAAPIAVAPGAAQKPAAKGDVGGAVRVPIDGLPAFGSAHALVTLVAFTDYECPYCAKAEDRIATLRKEYGDRLRVVVNSRPLPIHEGAPGAALAFLAAVEQGKGEAMHTRLFANPRALDEGGLRQMAQEIGLDLPSFDRARASAATRDALRRAEARADTLFVAGTPTFFVNGRRLVGAQPIQTFRSLIDEELSKAQAIVDKGVAPSKVYQTILSASPEPSAPQKEEEPAETVDVGIENAPVRGSTRAPVTIVFFSDFECPFCVRAEETLRKLEVANPGKVRVAFRQRPLPMHPHAKLAAKASLAAERQNRFWEYHDVLIRHRDALEREDLEKYAADAGLDRSRFGRDLDDPLLDATLAAEEKRAADLDVKGTPTAFINGRRLTGAQPLATWQGIVDRALARSR